MSKDTDLLFATSYAIGWFPYVPLVWFLLFLWSSLAPGSADITAAHYVDKVDAYATNFYWIASICILMFTIAAWVMSNAMERKARQQYQLSQEVRWNGCLWKYLAVNVGLLLLLSPIIFVVAIQIHVDKVDESDFFVVNGDIVDARPVPGWYWEHELDEQGIRVYQYGEHQFAYYRGPDSNSYQLSIHVALHPNEEAWVMYKHHRIELQENGQEDHEWLEQLLKQWLMDEDANQLYQRTEVDGPIPQQYELHVAVEKYITPYLNNAGMTLVSAKKERVH